MGKTRTSYGNKLSDNASINVGADDRIRRPSVRSSYFTRLDRFNYSDYMAIPSNSDEEDSDSDETITVIEDQTPLDPAYFNVLKHLLIQSAPNVLYRLALSGNGVLDAIILRLTGDNVAVAAMPLMTTITQFVLYSCYNTLGATNLLVSEKKTQDKRALVGKVLRDAWWLSLALSVPVSAIMLAAKPLLVSLHVDEDVADCVETYYRIVMWANPPLLCLTSTHQFFLGLQRSEIVFVSGLVYILFNVLIGYPLALGKFGLPELGLSGMAYGVLASSCITSIVTHIYLWRSFEAKKYHVFSCQCQDTLQGIWDILRLGLPLGLQGLSEAGNMLLISTIVGVIGTESLLAMQVPFQMNALMNGMFVAIAQTMGVTIKESITLVRKLRDMLPRDSAVEYARRLGLVGMSMALTGALAASSLYLIMPDKLASAFIDFSTLDADSSGITQEAVMSALYPMLYSGAFDLILTALRLTMAGALSAYEDVVFPAVVSFISMTALAVPPSAVLTLMYDKSVNCLFIARDIGMSIEVVADWFRLGKREKALSQETRYFVVYDSDYEEDEDDSQLDLNWSGTSHASRHMFYQPVAKSMKTPFWEISQNDDDEEIFEEEKTEDKREMLDDVCLPIEPPALSSLCAIL